MENDYEKTRQENIRRNKERMLELKLPEMSKAVQPAAQPVKRKATSKGVKRTREPIVASRRSLRVMGMKPDGAQVKSEGKDGVVFSDSTRGLFNQPIQKPGPTRGPLSLFEDTDAKFLDILKGGSASKQASMLKQRKNSTDCSSLSKLSLEEENVVKLTRTGIVHLDVLPRKDTLVIAGADKDGNIGLWHQNGKPEDEIILQVRPHTAYISGLRWCSGHELFSCSYDGLVRKLDAHKSVFLEMFASEEYEFSAFDITRDGNTAVLCDNTGDFLMVDMRTNKAVAGPISLHNRKINTVHIEPMEENLITTSSTSTEVSIWDLRKLGKFKKPGQSNICTFAHAKSCQGAFFAPDGSQRVLTTCYDNHLRVWDSKQGDKFKASVSISHNTQTGRWVIPFRAVWTPASDGVIVGSMNRRADIYNAATGASETRHSSEFMTAIPSRFTVHKELPKLVAGTSSGRVHIFAA